MKTRTLIVVAALAASLLGSTGIAQAGCPSKTVSGGATETHATATFHGCLGKGAVTSTSFTTTHQTSSGWHWNNLSVVKNAGTNPHVWRLSFMWWKDAIVAGHLTRLNRYVYLGCSLYGTGSWVC